MSKGASEIWPDDVFLPYHTELYRVSIDENIRSAEAAFIDYGRSVDLNDVDDAARHLQNALTQCAAISRFFWPPRSTGPLGAYRGEQLRQIYRVDDTSPLADRNLRNELEHFDERLDAWLKTSPVGPIVASAIFGEHTVVDDDFGHVFKLIDIGESVFVILGKKFEFGPLSREVAGLLMNEQHDERSTTA